MRKFIFLFILISILIPTFSYAQTVQEMWTARYNGTGNNYDEAHAIAVDASGNVYVTGESKGSSGNLDYVTIKYSPNGNKVWEARYNGPGNGDDRATAIAVDGNNGSVYVTGESRGSSSYLDYATIKYDTNGNQLWVARYNGPVNSDDRAHGIALDGNGNVYVTGESKGTSTGLDYATIKYTASGTQTWVKRYNGPINNSDIAYAIAVDINGNIYVTGESKGSTSCLDYATVKYDINGNQKWVKRYNGSANYNDSAYAIGLDGSGNIYVTGKTKNSSSYYDYVTIKYDTYGTEKWVKTYNGPGNGDDVAYAMAVDSSGNVYVTGESKGNGTYKDYATVKYDTYGNEVWIARYNGSGNSDDSAYAITIDGNGNTYVTGGSINCPSDYATIKYDVNGNAVWIATYNGPANGSDIANAIAVDANGNVYVTGKSDGSSTNVDYLTIKYSALIANFSADLTSGNSPLTVQFTDKSTGNITSWSWNFGDAHTSTDQNPSHTYNSVGDFTVTLTVTGPGGSNTMQKTNFIHISPPPVSAAFHAEQTSVNKDVLVNFHDDSTGNIATWSWNFGDGSLTSNLQNPSHTYSTAGTYTVTLTVTGSGGGTSTKTVINYISVYNPPVAAFHAGQTSVNKNVAVNFYDDSTGNIATWSWNFGDGSPTSNLQNPSHTYSTAGTYTVTLTVTGSGGGTSTKTEINYIHVYNPPVAAFHGSPTSGNKDLTVDFHDDSTGNIATWSWNFGDGSPTSNLQNPSHTYSTAGTYTVTLTVTGSGGGTSTKTEINYIHVYNPPVAAFHGSPTSGNKDLTVDFHDDSTGNIATWSWNFGDGSPTSNLQNPSHTYTTVGTHTVTLTVTGSGGGTSTKTETNYISVHTPSSAAFHAGQTSVNKNVAVNFYDDSTGDIASWSWDFGDGGTSTSQNPSHTYTTASTYTVTLTVTGSGGGTSTETKTGYISVYNPPLAAFHAGQTSVNKNVAVNFYDDSTGDIASWSWDFGDGGTSTSKNPSHTYTTASTYTVTLTVTGSGGGTSTKTETNYIHVYNIPVAAFHGSPTSGNKDLTVDFHDDSTGDIASWSWDFGDGGTSTSKNPSHTYTTASTYTVTLTVTGSGGGTSTKTETNYIHVYNIPVAAFHGNPTSGNKDLTVDFHDDSTGDIASWLWNFGDGGTSTSQSPSHTYTTASTRTVTLTVTGSGGGTSMETKTGYISVYNPQVAAFHAGQTSVNEDVPVNFHDDSTGDIASWLWDFGDGGTSTSQSPSHTYTTASTYTVTLTVTGSGGGTSTETKTGYITVSVPIPPPPVADFSANVTSGNEPLEVLFKDKSTGAIDSWLWDFGDGDISTDQNPSHTYTDTGNFTVTLTVTGPGGSNSEIKTAYITVRECNVMVPQNYPTIQKAIDASEEGCTILVSSGTYLENINFHGKALRVKGVGTSGFCNCSSDMENKVTILGLYKTSVVTFNTGENRNSIIEGVIIKNGYAPVGGGILIDNASPTVRDCYIYENHAYSESTSVHGGGIAVTGSNASPLIFNNLIFKNTAQGPMADSNGGGVYVADGASPTIQNCTIADNTSKDAGDGIYVSGDSSLSIVDSIIWRNIGSDIYCETGCSMAVSYSDVGESIPGIGNISTDPIFVHGILGTSSLGNYYLSHVRAGQDKDSPCIDAGSTLALYAGLDIRNTATDGITDRGNVDMGFHYTPTLLYIEDALTSPGAVFGRGQNIRYSIVYTIEGNPDTLYKVTGKITVRGAYKYSVSRTEQHYPGAYTMHFDSTVPSTARSGSAVVTYKATLKQAGKKDKLAIDTRISEIGIR